MPSIVEVDAIGLTANIRAELRNDALDSLWENGRTFRTIIEAGRSLCRAAVSLCAFLVFFHTAHAEISDGKIKIGVLTDLSGPYEAGTGMGSVEAAKIAAEEFGYKINGVPIEIISADHQNKPDIGAGIARRRFNLEGVDAITDLVTSGVAFAALEVAKAANKAVLLTSAGSADFTGKACAPNNLVHWVYDTYQLGASIGQALPQLGKTWFFITVDYTFGKALQDGTTAAIEKNGGKVLGSVRHPLGTTDFSSYMVQAHNVALSATSGSNFSARNGVL